MKKPLRISLVLGVVLFGAGCGDGPSSSSSGPESLVYDLPADVGTPESDPTQQSSFDQFSWQSFVALNAPEPGGRVSLTGDNPTQWAKWSSSVDLIECNLGSPTCRCPDGDCSRSGARHYPPECLEVPGFERYRVLAEIDKADDSFLEADSGGLSNSPAIDSQGGFLRYEILPSPALYDSVVESGFYDWEVLLQRNDNVVLPCGEIEYQGGNPANPAMGAMTLKLAWMEEPLAGQKYHAEDLLVYTPGYRNITGRASCELRTMHLVGMHIAHKTARQQAWVWSTFEHVKNAPDCSGLPPMGAQKPLVNTGCPESLTEDWNLARADCAGGECAACNQTPTSNAAPGECQNPNAESSPGWCLDQPPAAEAGYSRLCRQVPVEENYPDAAARNLAWAATLGPDSVWSSYQLISTQWMAVSRDQGCANVQKEFETSKSRELQQPQVAVDADPGGGTVVPTRPFLGNTSMESYERSNCNACHSRAKLTNADEQTIGTDFSYWLSVETCAAWCDRQGIDPCTCL